MFKRHFLIAALIALILTHAEVTLTQSPGIVRQPAPPLGVEQWIHLPEGVESISLDDFEGKVVYIFCWQSW